MVAIVRIRYTYLLANLVGGDLAMSLKRAG
jgi:hypothetical protein